MTVSSPLTRHFARLVLAASCAALLPLPLAAAATPSARSAPARVQVALVNLGVDPNAQGTARIIDRSGRQRFQVEVSRLDAGTYDLYVAGTPRGVISVRAAGRGEIEFDSRPSRDDRGALLLDFDPRGQLVEVRRAGIALLSAVAPLAPGAGTTTELRIRTALEPNAALPRAKGNAEYRERRGSATFHVEVEELPQGSYALRVAGTEVATLQVMFNPATGENEGQVEFATRPETGKLPLTFDPRAKLIEVIGTGGVVLQVVFPLS